MGMGGVSTVSPRDVKGLDSAGYVQTVRSIYPDSQDAYDIGGTASKEFRSCYLGDDGRLYFGLSQDASIYRLAAGRLGIVGSTPEAERWVVGENPAEATKWISAVQGTITDPTLGAHNFGSRAHIRFAATTDDITAATALTAFTVDLIIADVNTRNWLGSSKAALDVYVLADTSSTGTIAEMRGAQFSMNTLGATFTTAKTAYIQAPAKTAPGVITNALTLHVTTPTVGVTTNLAVQIGTGTAGHSPAGLYCVDSAEFDGVVDFDNSVRCYNSILINTSNQGIYGNTTINEYYHLYGYDTGASAYQSVLKITNAATITAQFAADMTIGFFGATPAAQQAHIVDADGQLADITTKFNTLLSDLEGFGFLAAS